MKGLKRLVNYELLKQAVIKKLSAIATLGRAANLARPGGNIARNVSFLKKVRPRYPNAAWTPEPELRHERIKRIFSKPDTPYAFPSSEGSRGSWSREQALRGEIPVLRYKPGQIQGY